MSNVTRRALRVYAALNELKGNGNDERKAILKRKAQAGQEAMWVVDFTNAQGDGAPPDNHAQRHLHVVQVIAPRSCSFAP